MNNYSVYWTELATLDLTSIAQEIVNDDKPKVAAHVVSRIVTRTDFLGDFPYLGRPGRAKNSRELIVDDCYIVIYRVTDGRVRIMRVKHAKQRWPE